MRVLPEASAAEARRSLAVGKPQRRLRGRGYGRSPRLAILTLFLGVLLGLVYAHLMLPRRELVLNVLCGIGGACACYLLIAIPQMTWTVLRKQWVRVRLRWTQRRLGDLVDTAAHALERQTRESPTPPREALLDLAVVSGLRGEWEAAVESLRPLYEQGGSAREAGNLLVALNEASRWDDAAALVNQWFSLGGDFGDAALARVVGQARHPRMLATIWQHAKQKPWPRTLNNLGVRFLRSNDLLRAERALTRAVELSPSAPLPRANLGVLAYRREDYSLALTEMASAASLEPGEEAIFSNLGPVLCQVGSPRAARQWLRRAQVLSPTSAAALVNLGNTYAIEGRHEEAMEALTEAARSGEIAAAHHSAALLLGTHEHWDAALNEQRSAQELAPGDPDVLNNLGCLLWLTGQYADSVLHFEQAAEKPYHLTAKGNLVRAHLAAGGLKRARNLLLQPSYAEEEVAFDRGVLHLLIAVYEHGAGKGPLSPAAQGELAEAGDQFLQVIGHGEGPVTESHINLGIVEYLNDEYGRAAAAFAAADERSPEGGELCYPIAACYLTEAGQALDAVTHGYGPPPAKVQELLTKAEPYLQRALEVRKVADAAHLNLGVLHYIRGDYEKAIASLRPIARPDSPWQILNVLAIAQARQARELQTSLQSDPLLRAVKKRYMESEMERLLSAAVHFFGLVVRGQPQNALAHGNIGLAHYLRNQGDDVEKALFHWQRMRDIGGELAQRIYDRFTGAMSSDEAGTHRLEFQDIEVSFQPLPVHEWITCAPPHLVGLLYVVRELLDIGPPAIEAHHPLLQRALACRDRAERLRVASQRLM